MFEVGSIYKRSSSWQEDRWNELYSLFKSISTKKLLTGLDLGCGTGQRTFDFVEKEKSINHLYAIDNSSSMLDVAIRDFSHPKIEYIINSIEDLGKLSLTNIDVILANYSVHWVKHKAEMFEQLNKITSKGSVILLGTVEELPNMLRSIDDYLRENWGVDENEPYYFLKSYDWKKLLEQYGWSVVKEIKKTDDHIVMAGVDFLKEWYSASAGRAFYNVNMGVFNDLDIKNLEFFLTENYGINNKNLWLYKESTLLLVAQRQ